MDAYNQEKEPREWEEFDAQQKRTCQTGKVIVYIIGWVNIFLSVVSFFGSNNFLSLIVNIALSIALMCGVSWVRYLYVVFGVLSAFVTLMALPELLATGVSGIQWVAVGVMIAIAGFAAVSAALLIFHKGVKEFLYQRKNG